MTIVDAPSLELAGDVHSLRLRPWLNELTILTKDLRRVRLGKVIHPGQSRFITRCQHQLDTTGRIRQIVLKARQMGFSTIIEGIIFLLAMQVADMNGLIVSRDSKSSQGILRDRIRARLLAEMEAEHESLSARPDRVAAAEALIDRIIPDPANPKGER